LPAEAENKKKQKNIENRKEEKESKRKLVLRI
jgi:hypothetical protein